MSYQYSYLIGDLILLAIWLVLFLWRKDTRKEMAIISLLFGFLGMVVTLIYLMDWWHPLTITGTRIGIEDFIFGFSTAGIAAVVYSLFLRKKVKVRKVKKKRELKRNINLFFLIFIILLVFFGSFYIFKVHSFYAALVSVLIPLFIIWFKRRDLILNSILSGIFLVIISLPAYIIPELITPRWISSAWYLENLSGITILKVPLEDFIWFFLAGLFIGPLYEYWQEGKLINKK